MRCLERQESVPVKGRYEVVVAGGGVAGVAAALSAARAGRRVLLIEKSVMLGGLATLGRIDFFVALCNGRGRQIIGGLAEELLRLSIRYGLDTLPAEWVQGAPPPGTTTRYETRFSASIFALALTERICDEGVDLLYDSVVSAPVMKGGHCEGVIVESKSGREFYEAGMVVDATGDADVLHRAGVPTVQGLNYFTYLAHGITLDTCRKAVDAGNIRDAVRTFAGGRASLHGTRHPEGMKRYEGTTAQSVTEYVVANQRQLFDGLKGDNRTSREILALPGMAQFRTTRRIAGDCTVTEADTYRHVDDSVGAICDFERRDCLYEVPFRCLVRSGFDNLITAGRSAAGEGYAWDVLRVIPPAILTGQAAGLAAAHALASGKPIHAVGIPGLQRALAAAGVTIHFDDDLVPAATAPAAANDDNGHL